MDLLTQQVAEPGGREGYRLLQGEWYRIHVTGSGDRGAHDDRLHFYEVRNAIAVNFGAEIVKRLYKSEHSVHLSSLVEPDFAGHRRNQSHFF